MSVRIAIARADENTESGAFAGTTVLQGKVRVGHGKYKVEVLEVYPDHTVEQAVPHSSTKRHHSSVFR